ncbi:hypothetical protein PUNSTDRAFT_54031 [Punctularia strigosozonata HHB-11173 SS5]|uniref:uncharacterized protein n=1 Tax=Punctularia strigosozonata (strain HHB-11173) TaxID=741275 RepID=UPI0004416675|nr:uncharacterized protein PUNSTDRAFT_54031 [Punctularia strigosozonata HHB-11173 SS5]EIN06622.1 hypothetical protein PUNSTDRAFT_54031 [Punctularia strigosozonata HHB-11173 SS5]
MSVGGITDAAGGGTAQGNCFRRRRSIPSRLQARENVTPIEPACVTGEDGSRGQ